MMRWKKFLVLNIFTAASFFLLGFLYKYQVPRIERWLLLKIENQSTAHLPLRIWPQKVKIALAPPGLIFTDVRVLPQGELKSKIVPFQIQEVGIKIDWISLLMGRPKISLIYFNDAELKIIFKKNKTPPPSFTWKDLASILEKISSLPIDEIQVNQLSLWLHLKAENLALKLSQLNLSVKNKSHHVRFQMASPSSFVKFQSQVQPFPLSFSLGGIIENQLLQITNLKINSSQSYLIGTGKIKARETPPQPSSEKKSSLTEQSEMKWISRLSLNLNDLRTWENFLQTHIFPIMSGNLKTDLAIEGSLDHPKMTAQILAQKVQIDKFIVGDLESKFQWENSSLKIPTIKINNSSGEVQLQELTWNRLENKFSKMKVKINQVELSQLLANLGISNVPLFLKNSGELDCEPKLNNPLSHSSLHCSGNLLAQNFKVFAGPQKKETLVALPNVKITGNLDITSRQVQYNAKIHLGKMSNGNSDGIISYRDGFKINYEGAPLYFSDLENLAHLEFKGETKIEGNVEGTSKWARFRMNLNANDFFLEKYWLGNIQTILSYKKGQLYFQNIVGQANTSRYSGELVIDLLKHQLQLKAKSPYLELADLSEIFKRKSQIPLTLSGSGTCDLKAWGPLKFNALSYQLNSQFFRGSFAGENFDQVIFNVQAKDGYMSTDVVQISKGSSLVGIKGQITPKGNIEASAYGRKLRLEESEWINRVGLDISGQVDLSMKINGSLPTPTYDINGSISNLMASDQGLSNSVFKLKVTPDSLTSSGQLMGDIVDYKLEYPFHPNGKAKLWAKTNQWNFIPFFSLFSSSIKQKEILSSITSTVDLQSEKGGMTQLSGPWDISDLKLQRGLNVLHNDQNITLKFKEGRISAPGFSLSGGGDSLKFTLNEISLDKLSGEINGKLNLNLATIFTPFLSDLQGILNLNLGFTGTLKSPQMSGSAYLDQVQFKLRQFPHPITSLRANLAFNHQDILINSLRADLGGGQITGEGNIKLTSLDSIPINIIGKISNINLNVPDGFKSKGSGTWYFRGSNFPYTFGADYLVESGEIVSEFANENVSGNRVVTPSSLLPKFLIQGSSQPILLDLAVHLKTPLMIKNSMAQAFVKGDLQVLGPPNQVKLNGVITPIPGGQIYSRNIPFEINNGYIEYFDDPPDNPKIYLAAQTQIKETVREEQNSNREKDNIYEVSLLVQGRARKPKITLTSLPSLTEKEIISLLTLGMTPTALDTSRTASQLASSNSIQIGTAILQKPINKELKSRLGLDVQIGQAVSATENASVPKLTINKQFTPKWLASASRTLDKAPNNNVKMEFKMNKNFSVIGSWDGKEGTAQLDKEKDVSQSVFGLDLEFKVNFK
ncbi:MAG: translocation/assembly module TamB domain-containing protein [Bdellovibrionales bacterium]|nr:translocation/assembly module TamB domain-containing protein [Bdellovibrionales bacterium]